MLFIVFFICPISRCFFNTKILNCFIKRRKKFNNTSPYIRILYKSLRQSSMHKKASHRISKVSKLIFKKPISNLLTFCHFQLSAKRNYKNLLFKRNFDIVSARLR